MKMFILLTVQAISREGLTDKDKESGIKCRVFYSLETTTKQGLKSVEVKSAKSALDLDEKSVLNKPTLFEVQQTVIGSEFKPSIYYKIIGIHKGV